MVSTLACEVSDACLLVLLDILYYYYSVQVLFIVKVFSASIEKSVILQKALSTAKSFFP